MMEPREWSYGISDFVLCFMSMISFSWPKMKTCDKYESYLDTIKNTKYRVILSKFRLSSHDLEIERGRYGHKFNKSGGTLL